MSEEAGNPFQQRLERVFVLCFQRVEKPENSNPSLSATESVSLIICYLPAQIARIWPENRDFLRNQRITIAPMIPRLAPDSLKATVAVPF
jgi:hypothetical protein